MVDVADTGTGITMTFATSGFSGEILEIPNPPEFVREALEYTKLNPDANSANGFGKVQRIASDIISVQPLEIMGNFDPGVSPPIDDAAETITITFPGGETWVFTGFMTNYKPGALNHGRMEYNATIAIDGEIVITDA